MTREIKFRAWDKDSSTMLYPKDYDQSDLYLDCPSGEPFLMAYTGGFDDYSNGVEVKDAVIMQFTGLTDSLGKECWEGDKVKCTHPNSTHHGFVKYFDEFACYGIADENGKYICSLGAFAGDGFKVMGNIYENPELLEV